MAANLAVTMLPVALGRAPGQCALYSAPHNVLDGTVRCGDSPTGWGMLKRQTVDIVRLDDVLAEWLPTLRGRVGALKIDTEGAFYWCSLWRKII